MEIQKMSINNNRVNEMFNYFNNCIFTPYKQEYNLNQCDFFVAGGAVRDHINNDQIPRDLDVIAMNQETQDRLIKFEDIFTHTQFKFIDINSLIIDPIQWCQQVPFIMSACGLTEEYFYYHPYWWDHIAQRLISINTTQTMYTSVGSAIKKAIQHSNKSYYLHDDEITKIIEHFNYEKVK